MKTTHKLWIGLAILAVLTPLGLLLPIWLGAGSAWGEWGAEDIGKLVGYVPHQLERLGGLWHAPLPDYSRPGEPPAGLLGQSLWYIVCAVVGMAVVVGLSLLLGRLLARHEQSTTDMDE